MHYQVPPFEERKLVRCTRGAIYDVLADLCEPLLSRIRRVIPSMVAGLDLSFLWAIIALQALIILISGLRY
jgi:uncharacterized protein YggT (Ycf19 family)